MTQTITLDNLSDPHGYARLTHQKWYWVLQSGFILNNQDILERAWFHYCSKLRKKRMLPSEEHTENNFGKAVLTYDDSVCQLKGSTPKTLVTALQYWWITEGEW